ncbi:mitochondrial trehalose-6-phosphate synthase [Andalucia godoyi]|uniref:Mitochondrial trehalose-6-phosphate synthase n=1 Tax=Andalucia godoyi TaxID=505711 RepID=A0A8K0AHF2_ANDGO|nr:mitochondrial trehalose-6-phosphate synthase [Andalucia godoyi]|eukprot:ANDGO_01399.mRNA.1 mitochondrial trehalose-6-phosphate synthase
MTMHRRRVSFTSPTADSTSRVPTSTSFSDLKTIAHSLSSTSISSSVSFHSVRSHSSSSSADEVGDSDDEGLQESVNRPRLLIIANRLPVTLSRSADSGTWTAKASSGGLVSGVSGINSQSAKSDQGSVKYDMVWIGWPGLAVEDDADKRAIDTLLSTPAASSSSSSSSSGINTMAAVYLDEDTSAKYYAGYSNSVLWPLLHYDASSALQLSSTHPEWWTAYVKANEAFAEAVMREYRDGDIVWVHDYHLLLLPSMLREKFRQDARMKREMMIGFFLHTAWPSSEIFRMLPHRRELLNGVVAADLVSFHTYDYARHFVSAAQRIIGVPLVHQDSQEVHSRDQSLVPCGSGMVLLEPHRTSPTTIGIHPIGIDTWKWVSEVKTEPVQQRIAQLASFLGLRSSGGGRNRMMILGVDRLDPIKGIPHRLAAFESLLTKHKHMRDSVILVQIAVPSRSDVEEYQILERKVAETVGRINGHFGSLGSALPQLANQPATTTASGYPGPVLYLHQSVDPVTLQALYALADVCLITSLRDGQNLVALEYIACQPQPAATPTTKPLTKSACLAAPDCQPETAPLKQPVPGVLVISEFAGSALSLAGAIRINPWDMQSVVGALECALSMSDSDRWARQSTLFEYISRHTAARWGQAFVADLFRAYERSRLASQICNPPPLLSMQQLFQSISVSSQKFSTSEADQPPSAANHSTSTDTSTDTSTGTRTTVFVLDYEGSLVYASKSAVPALQPPSSALLGLLGQLTALSNTVVAVITARDKRTALEWFCGIDNLVIAAENGIFATKIKQNAEKGRANVIHDWQLIGAKPKGEVEQAPLMIPSVRVIEEGLVETKNRCNLDDNVLDVLNFFGERTPGCVMDVREYSAGFYFRASDPEFGEHQARELRFHLTTQVGAGAPIQVLSTHKGLEIMPANCGKLQFVEWLMHNAVPFSQHTDFVVSNDYVLPVSPGKASHFFGNQLGSSSGVGGESPVLVVYAGDGEADEPVFRFLNNLNERFHSSHWTIRIGQEESAAKFSIERVSDMILLLERIVARAPPPSPSHSKTKTQPVVVSS